jgi:hypothetical protein
VPVDDELTLPMFRPAAQAAEPVETPTETEVRK